MLRLRCYERILIGNRRFWMGWSVSTKFSHRRGCPPPSIFARIDRLGLTTLSLTAFTQRNFVADFFERGALLDRKLPFWVVGPGMLNLGATWAVHLKLIGKRVVDFLLVIIEGFSHRCYGWGAASENRSKIGVFEGTGSVWPQFQVQPTILRVEN